MNHLKFLQTTLLIATFGLAGAPFAGTLNACSVAMCGGRGIEMESSFRVVVKMESRGLTGANVEVENTKTRQLVFEGKTDSTGRVKIKLPPGDYWIRVTYLGLGADSHCFHVRRWSSFGAKVILRYTWGDWGVSMRSVKGRLQEWQPGQGGTLIWNLAHSTNRPISGARLLLINAVTQHAVRADSDAEGVFGFVTVPDGLYVLHIEGGATARPYEPYDMVVPVSHATGRDSLALTLREDGCGFYTFSPQWR